MKKTDIKRLEKAVEHYDKVVQLLVQAEHSIWRGDIERLPNGQATIYQVRSMRISAEVDRKALSDNIHVYNELFVTE